MPVPATQKAAPKLSGTLLTRGPWGSMFSRSGWRVYPYHLGGKVRQDSTGLTAYIHGVGEFQAGDYVMQCRATFYGGAALLVPTPAQISRVSVVGTSDDTLTLSAALVLYSGDYLLNLGSDTAAPSGTQTPNYDGSRDTIYTDPVNSTVSSQKYLLTADGGQYEGWLASGIALCDILVADLSGTPKILIPHVSLGHEVAL